MFTKIWEELSASVCNLFHSHPPDTLSSSRHSFISLQMLWQQTSCSCVETTHLLVIAPHLLVFSYLLSQLCFASDCTSWGRKHLECVFTWCCEFLFLLLMLRNLSNFKHFKYWNSKCHSISTSNLIFLYSESSLDAKWIWYVFSFWHHKCLFTHEHQLCICTQGRCKNSNCFFFRVLL